jgi:cytochrome c-type biogenesis protein CcmF
LGVVLLGTLYPLLTEAFDLRVSVGPPYFNPVGAVFFLPMLAVLAVGPLLRWRTDSFARVRGPINATFALAAAVLLAVWLLSGIDLLPLLGIALAAAVALGSLLPLRGRDLRRLPLPVWGMVLSHFGVGVALFGMAADTAFQEERLVAAGVGDVVAVGPWQARVTDVVPTAGPNWTAMEAQLAFSYDGGTPRMARPQSRQFWSPPQETSEVALLTRWNGQLYVAVGNQVENDRWQLRLWWKPFVTFIWYGGVLIALGGALALVGRAAGDLRRRQAVRRIEERRTDEARAALQLAREGA